jgi:beta-galactosidase/beta-glucuronidase
MSDSPKWLEDAIFPSSYEYDRMKRITLDGEWLLRWEDGERAALCFETLDLAARICLNGVEIGSHENAFRPCRLDVTDALRSGANELVARNFFDILPGLPVEMPWPEQRGKPKIRHMGNDLSSKQGYRQRGTLI